MISLSYLFELKKWTPQQISTNRKLNKLIKNSPNLRNRARNTIHNSMIAQAVSTAPKQRNALYRGAFKLKGMNT